MRTLKLARVWSIAVACVAGGFNLSQAHAQSISIVQAIGIYTQFSSGTTHTVASVIDTFNSNTLNLYVSPPMRTSSPYGVDCVKWVQNWQVLYYNANSQVATAMSSDSEYIKQLMQYPSTNSTAALVISTFVSTIQHDEQLGLSNQPPHCPSY